MTKAQAESASVIVVTLRNKQGEPVDCPVEPAELIQVRVLPNGCNLLHGSGCTLEWVVERSKAAAPLSVLQAFGHHGTVTQQLVITMSGTVDEYKQHAEFHTQQLREAVSAKFGVQVQVADMCVGMCVGRTISLALDLPIPRTLRKRASRLRECDWTMSHLWCLIVRDIELSITD